MTSSIIITSVIRWKPPQGCEHHGTLRSLETLVFAGLNAGGSPEHLEKMPPPKTAPSKPASSF
jgi:hypothetical protein